MWSYKIHVDTDSDTLGRLTKGLLEGGEYQPCLGGEFKAEASRISDNDKDVFIWCIF